MKKLLLILITFTFLSTTLNVYSQELSNPIPTKSFVNTSSNGSLFTRTVFSQSLDGNFLGDDPNRKVSIYLPPGYDENQDIHYPLITVLAYHGGNHTSWFNYGGEDLSKVMDELINNGSIDPMIIVSPDCKNKFNDCHFANSSLSGNWGLW